MSVDFDKFDQMVDNKELKKQMEAAPEYDDVPKGSYRCSIEKMEVKPTKAGDKLMFAVQLKIKETLDAPKKQDKRFIFWNRVICGNKTTDKWNDGVAIKGVITWISKILTEDDEPIEFKNYKKFADDVLDIYQDICSGIEVDVDYDPDGFNPITIKDVTDI